MRSLVPRRQTWRLLSWLFLLTLCLVPAMAEEVALPELPLADDSRPRDVVAENIDLAWDYYLGGGLEKALTELAAWERANPNIPDYPFTRGVLLYEAGDFSRALDGFTQTIALNATGQNGLWAHLYASDILLTQHITPRASALLQQALHFEGTPRSLLFAANLRQRIRIREEELTEVNEVDGITYYLPPYLIPPTERPAFYDSVGRQWAQSIEFLGLEANTPAPTIYLYPTDRLYRKFFPVDADLTQEMFAHQEVHIIYPKDGDLLPVLAPYALHRLQRTVNRDATPFYLIPGGIDDAVRGTTEEGLGLGAFCRAAKESGRLPQVESLLDIRNADRIPTAVAEPMMGLLLQLLHQKLKMADLRHALVQPAFLGALPRGTTSWQPDFDAFLTTSADLLEDPLGLESAIQEIPPFAPIPIVDPSLQTDLLAATALYEEGRDEEGRQKVEAILAREPRYGEARYLLAKDLYEDNQLDAAAMAFERVLQDTAPHSSALAFSHFYLGRLRKLHADYDAAMHHYQSALAAGLPEPRRTEAVEYLDAIQHYVALQPAPEPSGTDPSPFFKDLDLSLAGGQGLATPGVISPDADYSRLEALSQWYFAPDHTSHGIAWEHKLLRYSQRSATATVAEVEVRRLDAAGKVARGSKPERRRFALFMGPSGVQVVDFADESAIFRLTGRMPGIEG